MKGEDFSNRNYYYVPVSINERLPPLHVYVPVVDSENEIVIYMLTENGWSMRDGIADNSPNNNYPIYCWLEKRLVIS